MQIKTSKITAIPWRLAAVAVMIALCGCGKDAAPTTADEGRAKDVLQTTLASWKEGKSVEELKKASPSILVSDTKWERGTRLSKFEIASAGKPAGAEREFTVNLWLTDPKGKDAREQVVYKVGTDPILTVFRALF